MTSSLPVPAAGGSGTRAIAKAERAGMIDQLRAVGQGQVASIRERFELTDATRRIEGGYSLFGYSMKRTIELHRQVQSIPDDDLRELLAAGLEATLAAAVARTRSYMGAY